MTLEAIGLNSDVKIEGSVILPLILQITGATTTGPENGGVDSAGPASKSPVPPGNRTRGRSDANPTKSPDFQNALKSHQTVSTPFISNAGFR